MGDSIAFVRAAHLLAAAARRQGLAVPSFRSPPRQTGVNRSLRRRSPGPALVAVRLRGRPLARVLDDMVDGVVAANGLVGAPAERCRRRLREALAEQLAELRRA